ncbi:MAG: Na+/H+ antiporter NhaA [Collinsella bouchesdurhonensis]|nr:Na+/H+ antiporter NhaA [Collinsella bouchesdurhonensis]
MSTSNATGHNTAATPQSKIVAVPAVARRYARKPAIQRITSNGTIAAAAMVLAAIVAVIVANTDAYFAVREFLEAPLAVQVGPFIGSISLEGFINDFLMAIFFLSVGIELKYELTAGVLTNPRHALMPILAACGGVAVPALIYSAFNAGGNIGGWAVPIATDIAFALGIMSLAGDKVAPAAKVFFSTLAIADDLLGIIVIALFYGQTPSIPWLAAAVGVCVLLGLLNVLQVFHARYYVVLGILLWFCMLNSGVHATLAGVILAFFLPARSDIRLDSVKDWLSDRGDELDDIYDPQMHVLGQHEFTHTAKRVENIMHRVTPPLQRVETTIATPVNFIILPLFAFANAQLRLVGVDMASVVSDPVAMGCFFGLVLGKPIGIIAVTALSVKIGFSPLPEGATWGQMLCVGVLGGVGFTMCILISGLSFSSGPEQLAAKCAVLAASVTASLLGLALLNVTHAAEVRKGKQVAVE